MKKNRITYISFIIFVFLFNTSYAFEASINHTKQTKAKKSFKDIKYKIDFDKFLIRVEKILLNISENIRVLSIKNSINAGAYGYAYAICSKTLISFATEYPERKEEIKSCFANVNEANISFGGQSGTWIPSGFPAPFPWINSVASQESKPGIFLKLTACVGNVLGDELGDSLRRCVDVEYKNVASYIKQTLKTALKEQFRLEKIAKEKFKIFRKKRENSLSSEMTFFPDGTKIFSGEKFNQYLKTSYSYFSPSISDLNKIFKLNLNLFENIILKSKDLKSYEIDLLLNWYESFRSNNYKISEKICIDTLTDSKEDHKTYNIKLSVCSNYIESLYDRLLKKAMEQPAFTSNSKFERVLANIAYKKTKETILMELKQYNRLFLKITKKR